MPLILLLLGTYLLVGCFPIPSTQQYMTNGKLKPRYSIGSGSDKPIQLGNTSIDTAVEVLGQLTQGPNKNTSLLGFERPMSFWVRQSWIAFDDGRTYAMPYGKRTGYLVFPLCFMATGLSDGEYIVLKTDDQRRVIGYETVSNQAWLRDWQQRPQHKMFPPATQPLRKRATTQP